MIVDGKPDDGALLKWDLSSIPAGSTLQSATLSINVTNSTTDTYEIYEVKRTWTESQATWKKANSSTNWQTAGAQGTLDRGTTVLGTVTASATGIRNVVLNAAGLAVVQGWVNNPATNFGFIIQDYGNKTDDDLVFSSKEATVAANRPQLQLIYSPPIAAPLSAPVGGGGGGGAAALNVVQTSAGGSATPASKLVQSAPMAAAQTRSASLLLATQPAGKSKTASVDDALAALGDVNSTGWGKSFDEELLLDLASTITL